MKMMNSEAPCLGVLMTDNMMDHCGILHQIGLNADVCTMYKLERLQKIFTNINYPYIAVICMSSLFIYISFFLYGMCSHGRVYAHRYGHNFNRLICDLSDDIPSRILVCI